MSMSDKLKHKANGDRFLRLVLSFIQQHEKEIKGGVLVFSLNPSCLSYLNSVIKGESRVPPEFTDGDLQDISSFVTDLMSLKVESNTSKVLEKHKIIDLQIFRNLRILEIDYCKPSLVSNLAHLSLSLIKLSVHNSIVAFSELLAVEDDDTPVPLSPSSSPPSSSSSALSLSSPSAKPSRSPSMENLNPESWHNLRVLDCSHNYVPRIDSSVTQLTRVEKMDLSNNLLTKIENLQHCIYLSELNLNFNRINTMAHVNETVGSVRDLRLCNNLLESAEGLDKLYALETLDLSNNLLGDLRSVRMLGSLPLLSRLSLAGNPLVQLANYRVSVLALFDQQVILDNQETTTEEKEKVEESRPEPVSKKKKVPKTRRAAIEEVTTLPEEDVKVDKADDKDYTEILQMRQEMGEKWLLILNAMNQDTPEIRPAKLLHKLTHASPDPQHPSEPIQPVYNNNVATNQPQNVNNNNSTAQDTIHETKSPTNSGNSTAQSTTTQPSSHPDSLTTTNPTTSNPPVTATNTTFVPATHTTENTPPPNNPSLTPTLTPVAAPLQSGQHRLTMTATSPTNPTNPTITPSPAPSPVKSPPTVTVVSPKHPTLTAEFVPIAPLTLANDEPEHPPAPQPGVQPLPVASKAQTSLTRDDMEEPSDSEAIHMVVIREDSTGTVERFLEIKHDKVLELDIMGTLVLEMDVKNISDVKDLSSGGANTIEIANKIAGSTVNNLYHLKNQEDKRIVLDYLTPLLIKKLVQCVNCSTVFDSKTVDGNKCTKCGGEYLIEYADTQQTRSTSSADPVSSDSSEENLVAGQPTSTTPKIDPLQLLYDEDLYQESVKSDVNFQTQLKLKTFLNANEETFVYMFRTTYIKANANFDSESSVFLLLSTKSIYFLKKDKPTDEYTVLLSQPLSRLRRVVVGLFYQLFRLEIDTNPTPSASSAASSSFICLPRSHYRAHKFVDALMSTVRECAANFDPPELYHALRDTLYNINVCMMVPSFDVQLYVMLHYKSKFHKGSLPRSLVLSRERAYLCSEDYSRWPMVGGNHVQFEPTEMDKKAKREHAKLNWRKAAGYPHTAQFEPQFTRDIKDITGLQTLDADNAVIVLFEDETEGANAKENKNKPREWELVCVHPQEQQRLIKMLSFLWKNLFRIDLPIETKA